MELSNAKTLRGQMKLTSSNVETIFKECISDSKSNALSVHGVMLKVPFDRSKVSANRENILSMLSVLPDEFYVGRGGGWSFLNLCIDRFGNQWTDYHQTCDMLVCLGLAIGAVEFVFKQRELWQCFPGNMPYLTINLKKGEEE